MSGLIPGLLDDAARTKLMREARRVALKAGQTVFAPGRPCTDFLIVTAGIVKVWTATEGGRELVLYRVGEGQSCVVTTACLMAGRDYDAYGVAETECEALVIPRALFEEMTAGSAAFRRYVFSSFGERLASLIGLMQEVALRHVDRRLARHIAANAEGGSLAATHQAIASELGTAREVVSRLLKQFEEQGMVRLERGRIVVLDQAGLTRLAAV